MANHLLTNPPKKILVIKLRGLGDTLLATPAIRALRYAFPQAAITALVSPLGRTVLTRNPHINIIQVYHKAEGRWLQGLQQLFQVRRMGYDMVVALHASFRTALLALAAGTPRRVVHNHSGKNYFSTIPILAEKKSKSAIARDLDVIHALGLPDTGSDLVFPLDVSDYQNVQQLLLERGVSFGEPYWVLIPGAGQTKKRWPAAAIAAFLNQVQQCVPGKWVILAGPQEQELVREIEARANRMPIIVSADIFQAGALMALSRGVVTTDSGPKHVAVAVGIKTLTLWTNEPQAEWHPYPLAQHALLHSRTGMVADITAEEVCKAVHQHFVMNQE